MKYITIEGTELKVSALCLGTALFGANLSESESYTQMDYFFERGGNFLDTARIYSDWIPGEKGRSERIIGEYLTRRRITKNLVISTKGGHDLKPSTNIYCLKKQKLLDDLHSSLKALRTDCIDLYYLHRDNLDLAVEEIIDWMNKLVSDGKIRYFGCSNWKTQRIKDAQRYAKSSGKVGFVINQPLWNVGCYAMQALSDLTMVTMDNEMAQFHLETNLTVSPYSSQAGGFFSALDSHEMSVKEDALQSRYATSTNLALFSTLKALAKKYEVPISHIVIGYLLSNAITTVPVFSSRSIPELKETIDGSEISLSKNDIELINSQNGSGLII